MIRKFIYWTLISALFSLPAGAIAGGQQQRQFSVELALLAGDSRLLIEGGLSDQKRAWIEQRVQGQLNILPLLARYYLQHSGGVDNHLPGQLRELQHLRHHPSQLHQQALALSQLYPVDLAFDLSRSLKPAALQAVTELYNSLCLGCHVLPSAEKSVIKGTLSQFSRSMNQQEWLARLFGGLHGDAYTSYQNPFSDPQIGAFFIYIRNHLEPAVPNVSKERD
ncbi:MAG: hypothetical protein H8E21_14190 [Gammaproteobacteria bacterium]|nr:hypothetical protein [Gammaproteobacteria bacterium]MBL6998397.1 hypothetical protein [Gammaproteobacteria bacterium]